jgi:aspartokinase-like uncharacterized kinase
VSYKRYLMPIAPFGSAVVKVGGSLYDQPNLGPALRAYLATLNAPKILLVAGGGRLADVVRELDRCHKLGDEAAHGLAVHATHVSAWFLLNLLTHQENAQLTTRSAWWTENAFGRFHILDIRGFLIDYELNFGEVPHNWNLTTDSIAALAAKISQCRLILLKSIDIAADFRWQTAAVNGWVDAYFPTVVADASITIEVINFRRWLNESFRAEQLPQNIR